MKFLTFAALFVLLFFAPTACKAQNAPPKIEGATKKADVIELNSLDNTIKLDIRYATADNFVGKPVYPEARAFLQRPAAEAVVRVHQKLKKQGLGIVIFDGYRPWMVTKLFWDVTSGDQRNFVADPAKGSKHNRGMAIDLSLYDLKTGKNIEMPSGYDEFTERAYPSYTGGTPEQNRMRDLLRKEMEAEGFTVNSKEWWHFDYKDWEQYQIYDVQFSDVRDLDADFKNALVEERKDWKQFFDRANVSGGAYIYDLRRNRFLVYDRERLDKGFVPASTSKIVHSLIFLETGAVKDENEMLKWDGQKRWVDAWNQDHNLRSAFKVSAAWVYHDLSKRIGRETMQHYYDLTNYGNRSTDGFGEIYWVKGNLRVTPREQIAFLRRLYQNRLPFSERTVALVKDLMIGEKTDKYVLRAKTGWSQDYTPQVGWYVGYIERGQDVYFFATELDMKKDADAPKRIEITKNIFRDLKIIE
ncbi:MAG TPA: class D beta-lactamase [Pyrinomonadaceae bacterium]